ncbi:MAG: nucleotidyltransferase family protein [bacterium]
MNSGKMHEVNKTTILQFLREHKDVLEKNFGVTKIALFGSFARGQETENSDIDLLIDMKEHDFDKRYDLKEFLEEAFGRTVDVGYFDSVRKFIMRQILKEIVYVRTGTIFEL